MMFDGTSYGQFTIYDKRSSRRLGATNGRIQSPLQAVQQDLQADVEAAIHIQLRQVAGESPPGWNILPAARWRAAPVEPSRA
ncbi:MAG: hypothetical protein ACLQUY_24115 [Ktedonobacterales bacterium]